jgi:hypothetical protein
MFLILFAYYEEYVLKCLTTCGGREKDGQAIVQDIFDKIFTSWLQKLMRVSVSKLEEKSDSQLKKIFVTKVIKLGDQENCRRAFKEEMAHLRKLNKIELIYPMWSQESKVQNKR